MSATDDRLALWIAHSLGRHEDEPVPDCPDCEVIREALSDTENDDAAEGGR
jgi:hypothetical protein